MSSLNRFYEISRKIICVGRNYREHALELSNPIPKKPLIFVKTSNSYLLNGGEIIIPEGCKNLHHEVELGVIIGKTASRIKKEDAFSYVGGYTIALDMTARDLQDEFKAVGNPWYLAKSFDTSCPIGDFIDCSAIKDPHNVEIYCKVNGVIRQKSKTDCFLFDIPTLLEFTSKTVSLEPGDLVLTGTPAGVGQVKSGDEIEIGITGITKANFSIT